MKNNATERFSSRVDNYVKFRPHYPHAVSERLRKENILRDGMAIADVGSGTGFSAELFLGENCSVSGVEPNKEMREAAEKYLAGNENFHSVNGTAEQTTLQDHSVDLVVAGQAFHWFDVQKSKTEFRRILKPGGNVVLLWNDRRTDSTVFLRAYENFLNEFSTDYKEVNHKNTDEKIFDEFWGKGNWKFFSVENIQEFDYAGLKGRVLSSSYVPGENHPAFPQMLKALEELFGKFQQDGIVKFEYDTKVYYGNLI